MRSTVVLWVVLPLVAAVVAAPDRLARRQWEESDVNSWEPDWDSNLDLSPTTATGSSPAPVFTQDAWPPFPYESSTLASEPPICTPLIPTYSGSWWYTTLDHSTAHSAFLPPIANQTYPIHRNVLDYSADPTGQFSSTAAIQAAIDAGGPFLPASFRNTSTRGARYGSTLFPAVVHVPPGTYVLDGPLQLTLSGYNSNIIINDLTFYGGAIGIELSGQQWAVKSVSFNWCGIGAVVDCFDCVFVDITCIGVGICLDGSQTSGSLTVLDGWVAMTGTFVSSYASVDGYNQLVLENIESDGGDTVTLSGNVVVAGSIPYTWIRGQMYSKGNPYPSRQQGATVYTPRSSALLNGNNYFVMKPPTFSEYDSSQILNIKSLPDYPVFGDGSTDDTDSINAILNQYAGCKVIYFPAGTYIVQSTIFVPRDTRMIGDAYASLISARGPIFSNPQNPIPMIQIGNPGDVGVAQIIDMMFTVAEVLPGCKLVEVNMAGAAPGAVALINSHIRIGGAAGSTVQTSCGGSPDACRAAWGLVHLTAWSSAYVENMWGWTADHDLDDVFEQNIATGRGMLVEATRGTWLVGTAMEHNTLYQYNFHGAQNVFAALQQSETPYWQGIDSQTVAPWPWTYDLLPSDPDFAHCGDGDGGYCGAALFEKISASSGLFLYGGCLWTFFTGNESKRCRYDCQQEAIDVDDTSNGIYLYGTNVHKVTNMVRSGEWSIAGASTNEGGWGGVVAAYLYNS
ncbi:Pectin lyase fold/virulence factor [Macrophomina phaseolina MS6]|uniref:Pectin lyase fold/virulence factor n=1 Tax=Macrophomina phaseolina (strain MS6) TaxID=1126212 RepID=K2SJM9_MACPH|nr:Pectin lyase fold/virulence factor [Macrophomina phaseolina MS6]